MRCPSPKLRPICKGDYSVNTCGVPILPTSAQYIDIPHWFPYAISLTATGTSGALILDEKCINDMTTFFVWKSVSCAFRTTGVKVRFQKPDGRYVSNVRVDAPRQFDVASRRYCFENDVLIPAEHWIGIEWENTTNETQNVVLAFEGALRYFVTEN